MKNVDEYTIELYEKLYFHGIELRENLNGRLQLTLSIIVPILGGICYLISNFKNKHDATSQWFLVFLIGCFLFVLVAFYLFWQSWHGHKLTLLPKANLIDGHVKNVKSTNLSNREKQGEINDFLKEHFVNAETDNRKTYATKTTLLKNTNRALILSLICLIISFGIFSFCGLDKTPEVNISNPLVLSGDKLPYNQTRYLYIFLQQAANKNEVIKCLIAPQPKPRHKHVKKKKNNDKKNCKR
ncbi:MAG: hypothetical protein PHY54_15335 [Methylococcales bacterium]|nr:hypothetical protein [Methylococcales bacterium]